MLCGTHCEYDHQGVVETECYVAVVATGGDCEMFALGVALHKGAGVSVFVDCQYLVCAVLLTIYLEFCAWAGECSYFVATPRGLYAVVRGDIEQ